MVTRVGTATGTVARLSEMLRTSCELIRVFNTLWQSAGCGRYRPSWLTTCMAEWRVIDLGFGRTGFREGIARVTLLQERESYPLVSSGAAESAAENGQGKDLDSSFFLTHEPVNHEP
jgi:hypothetical protein